jgi:hypothetical protein
VYLTSYLICVIQGLSPEGIQLSIPNVTKQGRVDPIARHFANPSNNNHGEEEEEEEDVFNSHSVLGGSQKGGSPSNKGPSSPYSNMQGESTVFHILRFF